jgi:blocked-early-in-transport protein 1
MLNGTSFGAKPDPRDDLFSSYNRSASPSKSKQKARSSPYSAGYGYGAPADTSLGSYPGGASSNGSLYPANGGYGVGSGGVNGGAKGGYESPYRSATPNSRGQYSSAVLDELESQNDNEHVGVLTGKVKQLKEVCYPLLTPHFLLSSYASLFLCLQLWS